jgi:hypothetical protein
MPYRNINIDEDDLRFIENNKKLTGRKLQDFVNISIKKEIQEIKDTAEFIRKRRESQIELIAKTENK